MAKKPLFPRRQARTPSGRERAINRILIVLLAFVVGIFVWSGTRPGPPALPETLAAPPATLPVSTPAGWPRGAIETYDEASLYEKINGKADAYLAYRFDALEFAGYTDPARPDVFVDVYLYAFETPLDAFGLYRSQRSSAQPVPAAGGELGLGGAALFAWKGRRYLEVVASGPEAEAEAGALAERIRGALEEATPSASRPVCSTRTRDTPASGAAAPSGSTGSPTPTWPPTPTAPRRPSPRCRRPRRPRESPARRRRPTKSSARRPPSRRRGSACWASSTRRRLSARPRCSHASARRLETGR